MLARMSSSWEELGPAPFASWVRSSAMVVSCSLTVLVSVSIFLSFSARMLPRLPDAPNTRHERKWA